MRPQVVTHALHHLDQYHQLDNQDFFAKVFKFLRSFNVAAFSGATPSEARISLASKTALQAKKYRAAC